MLGRRLRRPPARAHLLLLLLLLLPGNRRFGANDFCCIIAHDVTDDVTV